MRKWHKDGDEATAERQRTVTDATLPVDANARARKERGRRAGGRREGLTPGCGHITVTIRPHVETQVASIVLPGHPFCLSVGSNAYLSLVFAPSFPFLFSPFSSIFSHIPVFHFPLPIFVFSFVVLPGIVFSLCFASFFSLVTGPVFGKGATLPRAILASLQACVFSCFLSSSFRACC